MQYLSMTDSAKWFVKRVHTHERTNVDVVIVTDELNHESREMQTRSQKKSKNVKKGYS